jgi:hypothetical protein
MWVADVRPKFFECADGDRLMPWSKLFDEPIILSESRQLHTLRDAVHYITELPKAATTPSNGNSLWRV